MKYLILLISLILPINSFAACPKPVTYLTQGSPAVCTGYLFSPEMEKQAREAIEKNEKLVEIFKKQNELIDVQEKRIALEADRYSNIKKQLEAKNDQSFLEKMLWFAAGVVTTTLIVKNVK